MKMTTIIAFENMKYYRSKNILTGIAIFLTTLLLLVIPTVGKGAIDIQYAAVNKIYPTWHALFRKVGGFQDRPAEIYGHIHKGKRFYNRSA